MNNLETDIKVKYGARTSQYRHNVILPSLCYAEGVSGFSSIAEPHNKSTRRTIMMSELLK